MAKAIYNVKYKGKTEGRNITRNLSKAIRSLEKGRPILTHQERNEFPVIYRLEYSEGLVTVGISTYPTRKEGYESITLDFEGKEILVLRARQALEGLVKNLELI